MLYDDTTPIAALTVGQLKEIIREHSETTSTQKPQCGTRFVYGLRGIQQLFGVSHKTAQEYKDGIISDAVRQNGRKIVVDADLALELFSRRKG